jgi:hypothetical protein
VTLRALWSWIYGVTLIAIAIGCVLGAAYQWTHRAERDSTFMLGFYSVMLCFIAFGAVAIGIERIRGREAKTLRPVVRPDEWLVENYGPNGKHFSRGSEEKP